MDIMGANPVDAVVLVVVLVSAFLALLRGFVAELFTLIGLVVAAFAVVYGMPHALPVAEESLGKGLMAQSAAAGVLFFGALAVTSALSYVISWRIKKTQLSAIDRSLGFLFGLIRGALIVCLLYICITFIFPPPKEGEEVKPGTFQQVLKEARTGPALAAGARMLVSFAPDQGLSLDELTKNDTIRDLIQPQPKTNAAPREGYGGPARNDLSQMIDRAEGTAGEAE
jgi:membrane protein required for colicin V production